MKKNVMIVDDETAIQYAVEIILTAEGYNVVKASSGSECIAKLREGFAGLILMDIMMPGMDGWDTIKKILDNGLMGKNLVYMLTAVDEPGPKSYSVQEYIVDYITKPFEAEALLAAVKQGFSYLEPQDAQGN